MTSIGDEAFKYCNSLVEVTIPEGMTSIGKNAFEACYNLASVTIPASVEYIGNIAFSGCPNLTEVKYAGTKAQWEAIEKWGGIGSGFVVTCTDGAVRL